MSTDSLLPENRTALELALERTFKKQFDDIDHPFLKIWRPYECPEHLLPWLADAVGVDEWRPDDPEMDRRNQIATFWPRQRQAGMRVAIRRAVESMGFTPEFLPWYQTGKEPGTLEVRVWSDGKAITTDLSSRLDKRINRAISERDDVTLSTAFSNSGTQYTALFCGIGTVTTLYPGD